MFLVFYFLDSIVLRPHTMRYVFHIQTGAESGPGALGGAADIVDIADIDVGVKARVGRRWMVPYLVMFQVRPL